MDQLGQLALMGTEHAAWLAVGNELHALGVELNEQDRLNAAICRWGEELVALRFGDPSHVENALRDRRALCDQLQVPLG